MKGSRIVSSSSLTASGLLRGRAIGACEAALTTFILILLSTAASAQSRVTAVTLKADDARPTGQCPIAVVFHGSVTADGPGRVTYTFTRSDGAVAPPRELIFKGAGVQRVEATWTLGDTRALPRYDGWMAVRVLSPNQLESSHVTGQFTLTCRGGGQRGGRIVFVSERDRNYEIYIMNADGSGQTNLTNNSADDTGPRLSPDGTRIVFSSRRDGNNEIYMMSVDGSGLRRLTNDPGEDISPNWSPDGKKIVFAHGPNALASQLFMMNTDGSGITRVTHDSYYDTTPAWSPDGRHIAYSGGVGGVSHIYVLDLSNGTTRQITNDTKQDNEPDWSPDGGKIVFTRNDTVRDSEVWVMNADGSGQRDITNDHSLTDGDPAWSPDGQKIVFVKGPVGGPFNIYLMNSDGSGRVQITTTGHDAYPDW